MLTGETLFIFVSFGSITLFGLVLAWASWKERSHAARLEQEKAQRPHIAPANVRAIPARQAV